MKKSLILQLIIIFCMIITGCSNMSSLSYFNHFESNMDGTTYNISSTVYLAKDKRLDILNMSSLTDNELGISGTLEHLSGDVKIIYVTPDAEDILIADSNDTSDHTLTIDTKIPVQKGFGKIQLVGDNTSFELKLHITDINSNDYAYFTHEDTDDSSEEIETTVIDEEDAQNYNSEGRNIMPEDTQNLKILNDENRSYTELETKNSNIVLETNLEESTPVTVIIKYNFISTHKNMELGTITLQYKTEAGDDLPIMNKEKQYAISDYEEMDTMTRSITLPAGKNKLVLSSVSGSNFNLNFNIQIVKDINEKADNEIAKNRIP